MRRQARIKSKLADLAESASYDPPGDIRFAVAAWGGTFVAIALALLGLLVLWGVSTLLALYYAFKLADGSFGQGFAINALSTLMLIGAAPFLFEGLFLVKGGILTYIGFTAAVMVAAYHVGGGFRDFLLNLGCGCIFLLIADFWLDARFQEWMQVKSDDAVREIKESKVLF
jgi:hypothetical protein